MTPEDYYFEQMLDHHDDVVEVQEEAMGRAFKKVGMNDGNQFTTDDDSVELTSTTTDFYYKGMITKTVHMNDYLDMTFLYDWRGTAAYTYEGYSGSGITIEKIFDILEKAEQLRQAMDETMMQCLQELEEKRGDFGLEQREQTDELSPKPNTDLELDTDDFER